MSRILTPSSHYQACVDSLIARYAGVVRPLCIADKEHRPEHVGTCTFIQVAGKRYIVTAAHILRDYSQSSLHVAIVGRELIPTDGRWRTTPGDKADEYDFAFLEVGVDIAEGFVDAPDLPFAGSTHDVPNARYLAIGFPCSKNKPRKFVNLSESKVQASLHGYSAPLSRRFKFGRLGITSETHCALNFKKKVKVDGVNKTAPDPYGMSGGILLRVTDPIKCSSEVWSGLLIKWHKKKVIVALKSSFIVDAITNTS